jgi:hypothetical protein
MASSYEVLFVLNKAALLLKKLASRGVAGNATSEYRGIGMRRHGHPPELPHCKCHEG